MILGVPVGGRRRAREGGDRIWGCAESKGVGGHVAHRQVAVATQPRTSYLALSDGYTAQTPHLRIPPRTWRSPAPCCRLEANWRCLTARTSRCEVVIESGWG